MSVDDVVDSPYRWRYACPHGHRSVEIGVDRFRCRSCNDTFPKDDLTDLLEGSDR